MHGRKVVCSAGKESANRWKRGWIETGIKEAFADRILPVDARVMERWAQLEAATTRSGRRLAAMDGLIAATALAHELTLATRNQVDFAGRDVPLVDPWAGR
jgi:predicted nucleic acid-binding protein